MLSLSADHVAAFTLVPKAPDRTLDRRRLPVPPRRDREAGLRPVGRRRLLGPRQPPGLGGLRGRPGRDDVAPVQVRLVRADGGHEPRHPALPRGAAGRGRHAASDARRRRAADAGDWDVVVVGLGALGSAAAYWASRRPGIRVLGLERFEIGHRNGASEDVSRIIRRSLPPSRLRPADARAYEAWAEVERESGPQVVFRTGGLDVGPRETAEASRSTSSEYARAMTAEGVPFETLDGAGDHAPLARVAARRRARRAVPGRRRASRTRRAGNVAHRRLAPEHGADAPRRGRRSRAIEGGDGEAP